MTVQGRLPLFAANTLMSVMSIDLPFAASHPFISDRHSANYRIEQMWRDASNFYWVFKRQGVYHRRPLEATPYPPELRQYG